MFLFGNIILSYKYKKSGNMKYPVKKHFKNFTQFKFFK